MMRQTLGSRPTPDLVHISLGLDRQLKDWDTRVDLTYVLVKF